MTFTLSASTLETASCLARYRYYKLLHRKPNTIRSGADAGTCLHAGMSALLSGKPQEEQEQAILDKRATLPMEETDYRHGTYLVDAFAQLRAELLPMLPTWDILEVEKRDTCWLGAVSISKVHLNWLPRLGGVDGSDACDVRLQFIRDAVIRRKSDNRIIIFDLKTSSRDDGATVAAFQNSGQFKAYNWSWNEQHPNEPAFCVQPVRLILRAPSKTGVTYAVKLDPPVVFDVDTLAEWRRNTMRRAVDFLSRDPEDEADWPMIESGAGTCRNTWGTCDYLSVCTKPPGDRALKLATSVFRDARDRDNDNEGSE